MDGRNEMKVRKDLTKEAGRKQEMICASRPPRKSSPPRRHVPEGGTESLKSSTTLQTAHGRQPSPSKKGKRTPKKKRSGKKPKNEEKTAIVKETPQVQLIPAGSRGENSGTSQSKVSGGRGVTMADMRMLFEGFQENVELMMREQVDSIQRDLVEVSSRFESHFVEKAAFEALQDDVSVLRARVESMPSQQKREVHREPPQISSRDKRVNEDIGQCNDEKNQFLRPMPSIFDPIPTPYTRHSLGLCMGTASRYKVPCCHGLQIVRP